MATPASDAERLRLVERQLELECIRVEPGNVLAPFPCATPDPPGRVLVVDTGGSLTVYFRHDLPDRSRAEIATLSPRECFDNPTVVRSILSRDAPCDDVSRFRVCVIADPIRASAYPDVVRLPEANEQGFPVFGILDGSGVASSCSSIRENATSGEAYVYTEERFRGRGLAIQVASAWAHDLQLKGKTPFYSYLADNAPSAAVARKLGASPVCTALSYG